MDHSNHFMTALAAFFAIMNPIANAPVFIGLTANVDAATRRRIALRAVLLAFAIVTLFSLCGKMIFELFGITLSAFRIAGGILVALVGYHMLQGEQSSVHAPADETTDADDDSALDVSISPLALPILAGPGTIATAMSFSADLVFPRVFAVIAAFGLICIVTWATFVSGQALTRFLGQNAIKVVTRLMGLILTVIGVQMLVEGIQGAVRASATG